MVPKQYCQRVDTLDNLYLLYLVDQQQGLPSVHVTVTSMIAQVCATDDTSYKDF